MRGISDAELVAAVLAGDVESFAGLVRRYQDTCTRYAVRMVGSRADADDVLQAAFMRAFRGLGGCHDRERFGGWLYKIVVNECRTFSSRRRKRELRFVADEDAIDRATTAVSERDPEGGMSDHIELALARIPAEHREAFLLKHVEELSYEEISEITGVGVSALKMRVKRACNSLRDLLEGVYDG